MELREEAQNSNNTRPARGRRAERKAEAKTKKHHAAKKGKGGGLFPKKVPYAILVLLMGLAAIALLLAIILVDAFPADLTFIIIGVVLALLVLTSVLMARRTKWKRITGIVIGLVFVLAISTVTYYLGATYAMMNKISENDNFSNASTHAGSDIDLTTEPFNVYLTGIDRWAGEEDLDRSDVNMILTIHPVTKKILLTSIPRDTYVKLHTAQQMDKLTHTGVYGVDETINTVEDWLGVDLNYYVKLNFSAMRGIINAIGGIDVYSPVAFDSDISDCSYVKGWNHLNGKEALYFARERHAFEGQDAVRVENQQRVVKAIIKKLTSSTTLLTSYGDVMSVAGSNLETDMSYKEIQSLVKMQMTDLASWDIQSQKVEGEYDMDYVASLSSKRKYSVYRADQKSVDGCIQGIYELQNPPADEVAEALKNREKGFIANMIKKAADKARSVKDGKNGEEEA